MACYRPLVAYRARSPGPNGKRAVVFDKRESTGVELKLPCGNCIGCRLERSRQWAVRCMHEASLYEENCFITLTYDDDHLPESGSLVKWHFQDFMKRLRARIAPRRIRFFMCGEYGERFSRPHYHACIFGFDFPDKVGCARQGSEYRLYRSALLESVWTSGFSLIGDLSFESAAYVARYVTKKVNGERAFHHYMAMNPETGELYEIEPEFGLMSRRPGIGAEWYAKYHGEVFPSDSVLVNGRLTRPPRFYDKLLERDRPELLEEIKEERLREFGQHLEDQTYERLAVREACCKARHEKGKRDYETSDVFGF